MQTHELIDAVNDAERTTKQANRFYNKLANFLVGKLRLVTANNMSWDHDTLCALKRELSQYDAKKRQWKN